MTMFYCPSCRQNLDIELKKNHNYLPFHKKWRDELILRVVTRVSESRFFLKNVMRSQPKLEEPFSCPFCEEEIDQSQNKTICFGLFKHLSQATHLDNMTEFLRTTGAADSLVQKCSITKEEFRMVSCGPLASRSLYCAYVHKSSKLLREKVPAAVHPFDDSDAAPLPQVQGPMPAPAPKTPAVFTSPPAATPKTLISKDGIMQNASGFHAGKRVWGGGIVRVPKEEWVPWPVDLENAELQPRVRAPALTDVAPRVMTEHATAGGGPGEGNVHTGAKPPWEMDDDEEQQAVGPQPRTPAASIAVNKSDRGGKRAREEKEAEKDMWLPNFGGTFHIGPRREFKETFRQELEEESKRRAARASLDAAPVQSYVSRRDAVHRDLQPPTERPPLQPFAARTSSLPTPVPTVAPAAAPLAPTAPVAARQVTSTLPALIPASVPAAAPTVPVAKIALSEAMQRKREELIKRSQGQA